VVGVDVQGNREDSAAWLLFRRAALLLDSLPHPTDPSLPLHYAHSQMHQPDPTSTPPHTHTHTHTHHQQLGDLARLGILRLKHRRQRLQDDGRRQRARAKAPDDLQQRVEAAEDHLGHLVAEPLQEVVL